MAKEWILNSAMNRFQLNFKRNVGPTSESIRKCSPKNIDEWRDYYFKNVKPKDHIIELGKKLYIKITEVIQAEVSEITEQDCIDYMIQLVIDRTYEGYVTEIHTVYGQLQRILGVKIEPAPDEWDRLFNVDFYIKVKEKYIGLQIKPVNSNIQLPEIFKEYNLQSESHQKFTEVFGGKVFYLFSTKVGDKKEIQNKEIIDEIKKEIERLMAG
ncbi:MAG TPA: MjaI family restriction endonuclease [Bacteroidia bacterium]|nr:MjaI family restriction endonuclease [Sphingobacteriales bacterium]HPD63913.1 MjaI family restriction endonuclease [Bacteroidia bacterium]HRS57726.1 MjaI family restriction endonuclease [Bacteroidia bacterium]HRU67059.1 MjaI family restriction endonuclease [Bacteroidia bacterium]